MPTRRRPQHSTVVAYLALFVALGGTSAWAADKITSQDIARNAVRSKHIKKKAVKKSDIARGAVTGGKLADDSVGTATIADGSVGTLDIADGSVGTLDIADGSITHVKLSSDASPRWGVFNNGGALARGRGVVSSTMIAPAVYEVTFDRDVSECAWSATIARQAAADVAPGEIGVRPPAANPAGVIVNTFNSAGAPSINRFHLVVLC